DRLADIFCGGDIETFLATEMIGNSLQVHAGSIGKHPRRRAIKTVTAEYVDRALEQLLARLISAVSTRFSQWGGCRGPGFHKEILDHSTKSVNRMIIGRKMSSPAPPKIKPGTMPGFTSLSTRRWRSEEHTSEL